MKNKPDNYILIMSDQYDESTGDVIEWILHKNANFQRLNGKLEVEVKKIIVENEAIEILFKYQDKTFSTKNIKSFWYRRGNTMLKNIKIEKESELYSFMQEERYAALWFLTHEFDKKSKINQISSSKVNKLYQLEVASKCGLKIPDTIITDNVDAVEKFYRKQQSIIAKSLQSTFIALKKDKEYCLLTSDFNINDIEETSPSFFLTKFQKKIEKQFELRIFFIDEEFYTMAIFSQKNPKTVVDFRNYDHTKPNRTVPFKLPITIKKKISRLMKMLELQSGSLDMIVTENNEYYFLEVNPVGQFGMVSSPCNYNLEEKVTNTLLK